MGILGKKLSGSVTVHALNIEEAIVGEAEQSGASGFPVPEVKPAFFLSHAHLVGGMEVGFIYAKIADVASIRTGKVVELSLGVPEQTETVFQLTGIPPGLTIELPIKHRLVTGCIMPAQAQEKFSVGVKCPNINGNWFRNS